MFVLLQDRKFSESERQHTENTAREMRNVGASLKLMGMGFADDPEEPDTPVDS